MTDANQPATPAPVDRLTLFGLPTSLTPRQAATLRQFMTFVAGGMTVLGMISATQAKDFVDLVMNLNAAVSGVLAAVGSIVAVYNHGVAWYRASFGQQAKNVALQPNTMVVTTAPAASDAAVATVVAKLPEVVTVLTDPATATAAPSAKVIAPR